MCGRYILAQQLKAERHFGVRRTLWDYVVSYNVAPSQNVPVVRIADGEREGVMMRWGLIPFYAHGEPPKYSTINATVEKLESSPVWRGPWKRGQRCILPAAGFYEWHLSEDGHKQPFFIHLADQEVFGFAGLWDRSAKPDGTVIESCTIITVPPNRLMAEIHNTRQRMPAILSPEDLEAWLSGSLADAKAALRAYPEDLMVAYRVSTRVNSPRNDDESLIRPLDAASG